MRTYTDRGLKRAKELRADQSMPEKILWKYLRAGRLGFKFRRQHPFAPYILDFYCEDAKLCIEIDGGGHESSIDKDNARDQYLNRNGVKTIRYTASDITTKPDVIAEGIRVECCMRTGIDPW